MDSCVSISHRFDSGGYERRDPVCRGVLVLSCYPLHQNNGHVGFLGSGFPYVKQSSPTHLNLSFTFEFPYNALPYVYLYPFCAYENVLNLSFLRKNVYFVFIHPMKAEGKLDKPAETILVHWELLLLKIASTVASSYSSCTVSYI
jgi:hypothetical protein